MTCYFIVTIHNNIESSMYQNYIREVRPIVEKYGGRYLVRTNKVTAISKDWIPKRLILIRFPSRESLQQCFSSTEYANIRSKREMSVDSRAVIVESLDDEDQ